MARISPVLIILSSCIILCIILSQVVFSKAAPQSFFSVEKVTNEETDINQVDNTSKKEKVDSKSTIRKHHDTMDKADLDPHDDTNSLVASMSQEKNGKIYKPSGLHLEKDVSSQEDSGEQDEDDDDDVDEDDKGGIRKRNFPFKAKTWPKSTIPYKIHRSISTLEKQQIIHQSASSISNVTCVKWVNLTTETSAELGHESFVIVRPGSGGCSAHIGYEPNKRRKLNLGYGCYYGRIVTHEMFHVMGIHHEQCRSDRDEYITVHIDRAVEKQQHNYAKQDTKNNHPYDIESIMQYSAGSFSKDGQDVFEVKDDRLSFLIRSRVTMSFYDVSDVLSAYDCAGHCNQRTSPVCKYGILNHNCECYCMEGFTGRSCDTIVTDSDCGGYIAIKPGSTEEVIKSPNFPNKYPTGKVCRWLISNKDGWYPQITIDDFHLSSNGLHRCYHWLEIQYNLPGQTGVRKCGEITGEIWTSSADSSGTMILTFDSAYVADQPAEKGFLISVKAVGKECFTDPCIHGECTTKGPDSDAVCKCDPGFTGSFCEIQANKKATFDCTFEKSKCIFHNTDENDDFQWTRGQGPGYNKWTGPSGPYKGKHYMLADMPGNDNPAGEKAYLITKTNFREEVRCLRFYYNMHSHNTGSLNVYMEGKTIPFKKMWSEIGDQGDVWKKVVIDIPSTPGLRLTIEAVRGNQWESQIAIDELSLSYGTCPSQ